MTLLSKSGLGKKVAYATQYDPTILFAIPRQAKRDEIGVPHPLPFFGFDLWNHYEVSWLNQKGKPIVAIATICYNCESPCIIESKSMKLYFNSFNNAHFNDITTVENLIKNDLEEKIGADVLVNITPLSALNHDISFKNFDGVCLDEMDIECSAYHVNTSYLSTEDKIVEEILYSNLLKSNCLVTHQPDWGSVQIIYRGKRINHEGLLRYIVSFRDHDEFHEQCIERIFMDIMRTCHPDELTVYGRYTRRGGLDINPYRSTKKDFSNAQNLRLVRQ